MKYLQSIFVLLTLIIIVNVPSVTYYAKAQELPRLTHQQQVWLNALEWCESQGITTAINQNDVDGTPSFYSFQFKPDTFRGFAVKYGLKRAEISVYGDQIEIMTNMLNDPDITPKQWKYSLFPDCIQHKIGLPPRYAITASNYQS